ncbi:MAG: potassium channel family protein [Vicinamibacterales bacterium]
MPRFLQVPRTPIVRAVLLVAGVFIAGTIGYRVLENAPWWDAFFMTVITITTVGYEEEVSLSREGEIFTSFLILAGLGMLLFLLTELSRSVVEGELRQFLGRVRRSRMIERLTDHEIVCGYGRMGQAVVEELRQAGDVVVVFGRRDQISAFESQCGQAE